MLKFEWDESKNVGNFRKHGVWFEHASSAFRDSAALLFPDPEHSATEHREILLGMDEALLVLIVIFCERDAGTIRIISARKAKKLERERYEKGI